MTIACIAVRVATVLAGDGTGQSLEALGKFYKSCKFSAVSQNQLWTRKLLESHRKIDVSLSLALFSSDPKGPKHLNGVYEKGT